MQTVVRGLVNVSQPSVSRSIWEVTQAICARLFRKYVRMPTSGEVKSVKTRFFNIAGFPGVTGCIDCTHVQIISPGGDNAEVYRNRKGVFSINVQAVTGPELQFFDVVAGWPGSVHDSRIFENSRVMTSYEQRSVSGMLLEDKGYACLPYLMPPLKNHQTAAEKRQDAHLISSLPLILCSLAVYMYLMVSAIENMHHLN
ncbi:putative nuclease HARBI1 [Dermacentor silvarum]|uniref:putative nuclease HARBI1 n=1 Tax=Dermacentor silvarum TaxID=543639 RepID=UPI0021015BFF|nr:putative nuclease HARBI1 [Dermacentor silvarum]